MPEKYIIITTITLTIFIFLIIFREIMKKSQNNIDKKFIEKAIIDVALTNNGKVTPLLVSQYSKCPILFCKDQLDYFALIGIVEIKTNDNGSVHYLVKDLEKD